ncbi:FAD/NAD(P)-binding domain-containing protein [Rhizopogon vinicolor AM-OR11-026]|uniref:FAD/NAD(P)-binding domain-containing protein n=1 Tax=Rhizopogon vinicolor AM-OR11-026 TaxID=1314800 RepID=A0A1B7MUT9_9AGAM|nr:FAD/NAD(P)-binding domain-containing protein [Rhizopogon vinicolor AM-OR11-026]
MSSSSAAPKFRVAICGAGIGGLALAIAIEKFAQHDVQINVYESRDDITTAGAGISIALRATEIMRELGMYEEIFGVSTKFPSSDLVPSGPLVRKSDISEGGFKWFQRITKQEGLLMTRQDLVDILKQHLPASCTVHFNKHLTTYNKQPAGSIALHFADDSAATTDVLIGADGIRSSVRKTFFETIDRGLVNSSKIAHYANAYWTGSLIYRAMFPVEKLSKMDPNNVVSKGSVLFCGKGKVNCRNHWFYLPPNEVIIIPQHITSYLVSQGTLINVVAYVSDKQKAGTPFEGHWVSDVSREEFEEAFQNFEPAVKNLLKCCENPTRWALHVVNELPLSTCDRVALIGDACHAMTSHLGAGAGQAIEDAFVLGRLLAHPLTRLDNIHVALKIYQDVRLSVAQFIARESEDLGYMYEFNTPGYYDGTDRGNEGEEGSEGDGGAIAGWLKAERKLQESVTLYNAPLFSLL